jgi:hypothetical protein
MERLSLRRLPSGLPQPLPDFLFAENVTFARDRHELAGHQRGKRRVCMAGVGEKIDQQQPCTSYNRFAKIGEHLQDVTAGECIATGAPMLPPREDSIACRRASAASTTAAIVVASTRNFIFSSRGFERRRSTLELVPFPRVSRQRDFAMQEYLK